LKIPFTRPSIGVAEVRAVTRALRERHIGGNGPISKRVQQRIAQITGSPHALLTPNATQAMELLMIALNIGPGDEVILPSFSFVSMANAVLTRGATPVFCEIDAGTLNMDPADVARRLSKRTKMVMPVHYGGIAADLDALTRLCDDTGAFLFEDAAQGIGATWRGQPLGTIAPAGCLSFHETKNLTSGEGGALLIRDTDLFHRAEIVQEKGTNRSAFLRGEVDKYTWVDRGGSYVVADLLAALLEVQIERREELQRRRMDVWKVYYEGFADLERSGAVARPVVPEHAGHNAHIFFLIAESHALQRKILAHLKSKDIAATFHFQPLHSSPFALKNLPGVTRDLPHTDRAALQLVRLPLYSGLSRKDARRVVAETVAAVAS